MDSLKGTLTPMKVLQGTLNGGIAYGTFNYNELENKPSVNGTELVGNVTIDIPTKTSDLDNDSGFITDADVPTKTSELDNDSGFITSADIPTKTSELDNDSGFITEEDIPTIPTNTSQLNNDSGFLTINTTPVRSVNSLTGDVNLFIPNATSQLTNDAGFITDADAPVKSVNGQIGDVNLFIPNATSQLTNDAGFLTNATIAQTGTIEGVAIASFSDGADKVPVSELIVNITTTQAGSGTPSPSNPRAISGWSSCNIHRSGINLWDEEWEVGYISVLDGENSSSSSQVNIRSKNYIPIKPNVSLYLKANIVTVYCPIIFYDKDKKFLFSVAQTIWNRTITTPENAYYMRFYIHDSYGTTYNNDISINYPSTDTNYHSYNGGTDTISLGQTVYGGTLNVTTGELTITSEYIASYNGEAINEPWISSIDEYVPNTSPSTGAEVVYTLATPTTVQLTPTEVRTLLKDNNIIADTGDVNKLVYFKTGCEAIARLIEAMI